MHTTPLRFEDFISMIQKFLRALDFSPAEHIRVLGGDSQSGATSDRDVLDYALRMNRSVIVRRCKTLLLVVDGLIEISDGNMESAARIVRMSRSEFDNESLGSLLMKQDLADFERSLEMIQRMRI